jgi:hypothetical protein
MRHLRWPEKHEWDIGGAGKGVKRGTLTRKLDFLEYPYLHIPQVQVVYLSESIKSEF